MPALHFRHLRWKVACNRLQIAAARLSQPHVASDSMQAARQSGALHQLGLVLARPITNLKYLLPCFTQREPFATHGVGEGKASTAGGFPRFYKSVHVKEVPDEGGYQIMLDHRLLRTPARHPLVLPSRALAMAIAAEWEWQVKRIQPFTMPLMSLAATALDQPKHRDEVIQTMLHYLPTDSVLCREEPGELAERQAKLHGPILSWVHEQLGLRLEPTDSIFGAGLQDEQLAAVEQYMQGLDRWQLAAAEQVAACCKSVLMGLAATAQQLDIEQVLAAARLEEDHQIENWGLVEGGHDIDISDLRVRVAAPSLFLRLLRRR